MSSAGGHALFFFKCNDGNWSAFPPYVPMQKATTEHSPGPATAVAF
ncbi:hypothetical protein [Caballeronia catudaia]|nr:hypothetical protein [Caballeronia catudaia]